MNDFWPLFAEAFRLDLLGATLLAVLYGGAVGIERELKGKAAGLRTNILICVGAALFTQLSRSVVGDGQTGDPSRIAAQIVTGVGFIGAGTILQAKGHVTGLTSAATIWVVAAIGAALGAGAWLEATGVTVIILLVLGGLAPLEKYFQIQAQVTRLSIEVKDAMAAAAVERDVRESGLEVLEVWNEMQSDGQYVLHLVLRGSARLQDSVRLGLLRSSGAYRVAEE
ncbi:MAG: MgtC/SapB family protein [Gemmatimonadales bacterium]